jgi:hypothetical protein
VDNIKIGLKQIWWRDVHWVHVTQRSIQGLVAGFRGHDKKTSVYIKAEETMLTSSGTISFSRRVSSMELQLSKE